MRNKINKSLVGKLGIAAAVGLIGSNLLTPLSYPVFAQDEWNTATYSSSDDGYRVTYDGKSYTVALSDQPGTYRWGNKTLSDSTVNDGYENNNIWGGSGDNASNGYNPNPTNYDERQGPCDDGYHVPSRGEWNAIVTAWCHLDTNTCTESDLKHTSDWTAENGLININNSALASAFETSFNMGDSFYWSSSPNAGRAWNLSVNEYIVFPNNDSTRSSYNRVRCVKNSTSAGGSSSEQASSSSSSSLTWADVESGSLAQTLTDRLLSFIMPEHNVYLYAIAEANTYHVAYSGNQATSGTMENSTFRYDTAGTLRANAFERAGYSFSGWNTQADNSGTGYVDGASVLNWSATDGDTIEIFAQWIAKNDTPYVVYHFIKDLSTNTYTLSSTDNLSGTTDTDVEFNSKLKSFTGFTYSGGYLTGGETRPEGAGVTTGSIDKDGNLKIYLYYDRDYNNVYLNGNTGIATVTGSGRYEYGAEISANATPKTGYHFVRWEKRSSKSEIGLTD